MHSQGLHVLAINEHYFPIATVLNKENRTGATQILREKKLGIAVMLTHEIILIFLLKRSIKKKALKTNDTFYLFPSKIIKKNNKVMAKKR